MTELASKGKKTRTVKDPFPVPFGSENKTTETGLIMLQNCFILGQFDQVWRQH